MEKKPVDNGECVSSLFLDLSKASETIIHALLLVKLKAYGFSPNALKLLHTYLNNRKQLVQIYNIRNSALKALFLLGFTRLYR